MSDGGQNVVENLLTVSSAHLPTVDKKSQIGKSFAKETWVK
jgi:hypothetical protein